MPTNFKSIKKLRVLAKRCMCVFGKIIIKKCDYFTMQHSGTGL